jgi:hypothetical protein
MPRFQLYAAADGQFTCEVEAEDHEQAALIAQDQGSVWKLVDAPAMGELQLVKDLETGDEWEYE